MPIRRFDDNVYRLDRVPESSQPQHGSASSDLHTDATDSDSDSPDDEHASADADATRLMTVPGRHFSL